MGKWREGISRKEEREREREKEGRDDGGLLGRETRKGARYTGVLYTRGCGAHTVRDFVRKERGEKKGGCAEGEERKNESLTYGAPYGRGVEMGRLRLRHRADGAQGVVELGGGGNRVPGESSVFVVTSATATSACTAAASAGGAAAAATSAGASAVGAAAAARTAASSTA